MSLNNKDHNKPFTVITTHINADFDALACMMAAQKLYPEAVVIFPGSHEKTLRNFFIQSMIYLFNMVNIKEIDLTQVKRLILVDTRQPGRIGKFASIIERADVEIHIYDHHPPLENDIKGHYEVIETTGAAISIITQIIKEKNIPVSADEATIMCLGIYEDTGSFTFSSTTEKDFMAAAFLVSKGANLDIISNLISREMSYEQVGLLNDMLQAVVHYTIKGVDVAVTNVSTETYVPDFAFLVHKMVKMENLGAFFAIARMANKVYVVARSRISDVDAGLIVAKLGGGGHAFAASATIKDMTMAQTEKQLLDILYTHVRSSKRAKDLMSSPAIKADAQTTLEQARNLLTRYNINALLVIEQKNGQEVLLGYISRQVIAKAIYLKLDQACVHEYMSTELGIVKPDSELSEIQEQIIENKQRILPVVDKGKITGVITRTDLLNILVHQADYRKLNQPDPFKEEINARTRNVIRLMDERLPDDIIRLLKSAGEAADELGYGAYVVGGFVRDLFLVRSNEDIDIVIEGNGIEFAKKYAKIHNARVHTYEKFGTAVVIFPKGFKIDVVTARLEYYRFPADLPIVEMSSIKLDLYRRDFTINTLAIQLNPNRFGTLIDFFSAQKDIKEKAIRILHNLSFVEDPTRVFRAIRFEQRFGFTIGRLTSGLIKNSVKMGFFQKLSGRRAFNELRQILEEENPTPAVERMHDYDLLKIIHPDIKPTRKLIADFTAVKKVLAWHDLLFLDEEYLRWTVYFMMLIRQFNKQKSNEICQKFEMAPKYQVIFCKERFIADQCLYWLSFNKSLKNSELYRELSGFKVELLLYMMAAARRESIKKIISHYFTRLRQITTSIKGKDLMAMGIKPGPVYREIMDAVLDAKLNGQIKTCEEELDYAKVFISLTMNT
ncbi:Poly A polymerase head domain-containing protein [Desulfonema limicola]|uniref:Poly A polymerase head domain-containing protein n=1 Tax=Desulfonema limicola TaxID=45656 RepID=A0A975GIB4_9BACT|nr:CBS domain-containing protein [Desulfonema limicola]QTA82392.1 Poly A polymerase head domain-containing protein [Desulfonema limicola]